MEELNNMVDESVMDEEELCGLSRAAKAGLIAAAAVTGYGAYRIVKDKIVPAGKAVVGKVKSKLPKKTSDSEEKTEM